MPATPVLTKKQQKSSLSAKKARTKVIIRNVLPSPYSKYWPLVSNEHYQSLTDVLKQFLPRLLPDKVPIVWKEFKKVPRSERKIIRKELGKDNHREREGLILGINNVTKALENETAKCVLITADIQPQLMVEHLIDQCVLLGTPVLVIPELRTILKEKCGISSAAFAFTDYPRYKLVQDTVDDISKKYPIPQDHINYDRAQQLVNDSVIIIEDSIIEDISKTNLTDTNIADKATQESKTKFGESSNIASEDPVKNVYLIRKTKNERVFIPKESSKKPKMNKIDVDSTDFLSFSVDTTDEQNVKNNYKSLKVKRVRGDANRSKRKIEAMKKQKRNKKRKKGNA